MADAQPAGIACGSCGTLLPAEWINEARDKRTPCPKCRGTQRRTAVPKKDSPPPARRGLLAWISRVMGRGDR